MTFPPAFLDELRARLPLSSLVGKRLRLVRAGREFKGCCPFHNEKTPSFYVNDDKQFFHCFGCGAHGDIIGFTMRIDGASFPEAIENLASQAGLQVPQDTPVERERFDREKHLALLLERATAWFEEQLFAPQGREALAYLRNRGLSEEAMRRFRLGYAPNDGGAIIKALVQKFPSPTGEGQGGGLSASTNPPFTLEDLLAVGLIKKAEDRPDHYSFFRNRVMFPVGDRRGRTVAFGGRVMGEGEPKYLNSPDHALFHKGKLLYGLSRARTAIAQGQPIIVVEGYMDVIALVEAGYQGAVAPLGTALTEDQLSLLWRLLPALDAREPGRDYSPILCFDGDNAGLRAAARGVERALPLLTATQTIRVAYLPEGEDPDSLIKQSGKNAMQSVLDQAKPMIDVIWDLTAAGRRVQTPEDRAAFIAALKQKTARIADEPLRKLYQDAIQQKLSTAFQWQKPERTQTTPYKSRFNSGERGKFGSSPPPVTNLARKQPQNARQLWDRVFLAVILNHPVLFHDFGEDLTHITFADRQLEALRQRTVDLLSDDSHEPLDATELYRHLSDGDESAALRPVLAGVLSDHTYIHAGFAQVSQPVEAARQGWKSFWIKHLQESYTQDLEAAKRRHRENPSDANLDRMMALRHELQALISESAEKDAATSDFLSSR